MDTITYKPYCRKNRKALEDIIRQTWHYDAFCAPATARRMAAAYLASCLSNQTYTCVAHKNNRPIGIIMGKNCITHRISLSYLLREAAVTISLLVRREGRKTARLFSGISALDRQLLKNTGYSYKGEVAFFALHPDSRGLGIGKELFRRLKAYMRSEGISRFFLFTDTSCNYGFYEHQGMKRIGETAYSLPIPQKNDMHFFIYEYLSANTSQAMKAH